MESQDPHAARSQVRRRGQHAPERRSIRSSSWCDRPASPHPNLDDFDLVAGPVGGVRACNVGGGASAKTERLEAFPVGTLVNDPRNETKECIKPVS